MSSSAGKNPFPLCWSRLPMSGRNPLRKQSSFHLCLKRNTTHTQVKDSSSISLQATNSITIWAVSLGLWGFGLSFCLLGLLVVWFRKTISRTWMAVLVTCAVLHLPRRSPSWVRINKKPRRLGNTTFCGSRRSWGWVVTWSQLHIKCYPQPEVRGSHVSQGCAYWNRKLLKLLFSV